MQKEKPKEIQQLIDLAKEKGFLTFDEVNDALPEQITSADQIDDVLSMFDELDIEIVDNEEDGKKKKAEDSKNAESGAQAKEEDEAEEEVESAPISDTFSKTSDPVRMYLRKM